MVWPIKDPAKTLGLHPLTKLFDCEVVLQYKLGNSQLAWVVPKKTKTEIKFDVGFQNYPNLKE
jgi:hypothetical protein